jgi:hypothetical protein
MASSCAYGAHRCAFLPGRLRAVGLPVSPPPRAQRLREVTAGSAGRRPLRGDRERADSPIAPSPPQAHPTPCCCESDAVPTPLRKRANFRLRGGLWCGALARFLRIESLKACNALLQPLDATPLLSNCQDWRFRFGRRGGTTCHAKHSLGCDRGHRFRWAKLWIRMDAAPCRCDHRLALPADRVSTPSISP